MHAKAKVRFPVSERALLQRINRKLKADREIVKKSRAGRWQAELGTYFRLDWDRNFIIETHVDLEGTARKLKVLRSWEQLWKPES